MSHRGGCPAGRQEEVEQQARHKGENNTNEKDKLQRERNGRMKAEAEAFGRMLDRRFHVGRTHAQLASNTIAAGQWCLAMKYQLALVSFL